MSRPKSDIQERIVAAAHRRFLAEGVDAASLRNIAKDADTSIGMVYYYYTTKDDLFFAVVEESYQVIVADIEAGLQRSVSFAEKILAFYRRMIALSPHELEIIRLVVRESMTSHERRKRLLTRVARGHVALLMGAVLDAMKTGELNAGLNPFVAVACAFGIGGAPSLMLRVMRDAKNHLPEESEVPEVIRAAAASSLSEIPDDEALARILGELVMRALGGTPPGGPSLSAPA